jgi:tetratricopeptide (TPR) repeat protein
VFAEADSDNAGGRGSTIGVAIDHAVEKLEKEDIDPHVEAFLRASLANTYVGLGEWQHAKAQALAAAKAYEKGQLPDDEALSEVLRVVSEVQVETGAMKEGVVAAERSLKLEETFHGAAPHDHTAYSLHVAAIAHRFDNDLKGALELHHRAVDMERALLASTGHSYLSDALEQLCLTLVTFGRYDEARAAVTESLAMNEKKFGRAHQVTAISLAHLGWLEFNQGNLEAARKVFAEVNEARLKTLGPNHMRYAQGLHNAADVEVADGQLDAGEKLLDASLEVGRKAFGEGTGRYAWLELLRAEILIRRGRPQEALDLVDKDLALIRAHYGEERDATLEALVLKAKAERALGLQTDTAAKAKALGAKMYGEDHPIYRRQADAL